MRYGVFGISFILHRVKFSLMVNSSRRRGSQREILTNHNRCWIWGRHVVLETLRAGRWPILELCVSDQLGDELKAEVWRLAGLHGVETTVVNDQAIAKSCHSGEHQGFAARMSPFPCFSLEELQANWPANPLLVVLDRLQDPYNFGAIVRSASALGLDGIVMGAKGQVAVNSLVARSSAGAINHIPIARTESLGEAIDSLRGFGFQIVAASEKGSTKLCEADFGRPTVAIIGNEGDGIQPALLKRCDLALRIPMSGQVGSLNAAVAASVLFYEMRRQRQN